MSGPSANDIMRALRRLTAGDGGGLSDRELLHRFAALGDELAFAALVRRHGPMVLSTGRRVLSDAHDAEDVFQAAFLTLARRAGARGWDESVAGWLHTVTYRLALKVRAEARRRAARQMGMPPRPAPDPLAEVSARELCAALDEELNRLPEKYRAPVLLCCLEGLSRDEAARRLGWSFGALKGRLERGRDLLRERLRRRGLALSAGLASLALLPAGAQAAPPALLTAATLQTVLGESATSLSRIAFLSDGVLNAMFFGKLKAAAALTLTACVFGVAVLLGAASGDPEPRRDSPPPREADPIQGYFQDVTAASGVVHTYHNGEEAGHLAILESLGGGAALLDYDGDGLLDIFFPGGGSFAGADKKDITGRPCKLYKNLGGFKFRDVTKETGLDGIRFYTHGVAVADYDCDGHPDLLVTGWGGVALLHNEPDGKGGRRFVDVTAKSGLADPAWAVGAAFADLDGDGYPDLYVSRYVDWRFGGKDTHPSCTYDGKTADVCPPKQFQPLPHSVYRNNGDGTFADVSKTAGLRADGKGLGVVIVDVDGDGKPDIYVANDTTDNFLYLNKSTKGKIVLAEVGLAAGVARDERGMANGSMGVDAGDPFGTGRPALWVTNYENELHALYTHEGRGGAVTYRYDSNRAGIGALGQARVGWGTGFFDFDLDGWEDLVVAHGHAIRYPTGSARRAERALLLRNEPGAPVERRFEDVTARAGSYFQTDHLGRGVALGDLDNDGRVDLVFANLNEPAAVLRNVAGSGHHWVGFSLKRKDNRDVVGARVQVEAGGRTQTRFAKGGGGYLSASDTRHVFGFGKTDKIDRVTVTWPTGEKQTWESIKRDRYWRLGEGEKEARP